jgi:hypothetical protein
MNISINLPVASIAWILELVRDKRPDLRNDIEEVLKVLEPLPTHPSREMVLNLEPALVTLFDVLTEGPYEDLQPFADLLKATFEGLVKGHQEP